MPDPIDLFARASIPTNSTWQITSLSSAATSWLPAKIYLSHCTAVVGEISLLTIKLAETTFCLLSRAPVGTNERAIEIAMSPSIREKGLHQFFKPINRRFIQPSPILDLAVLSLSYKPLLGFRFEGKAVLTTRVGRISAKISLETRELVRLFANHVCVRRQPCWLCDVNTQSTRAEHNRLHTERPQLPHKTWNL